MLTHIIVPASSTIGEFFDRIFPDAGCLLIRLVECRTSNSESRDVLGWDVTWEELEPPRYVIFQPLDQISPTAWKGMVKSSSSLMPQRRVTYLKDTLL